MTRRTASFAGQVVAWVVILAVVAALVLAVLVPRIAGATPYTVLTGSMKPNYPPGTLIIAKPVEPDEVRIGDVVTIQLESGKSGFVTHRVVKVSTNLKGERSFTTQGDANNVADQDVRRPEQIRGKLWYSIPYLGYVNNALTGSQRQTAVYGVAGGLLLYAAYMFTGALRGAREETKGED